MKDYYSILGLPRYATEDQIKEAYRRLAHRWHPDINPLDPEAEGMMQDLNRAKEVLFEEHTREEYRKLLDMQDALSLENLERIRKKYKDDKHAKTVEIDLRYPFRRTVFTIAIVLLIIGVGSLGYYLSVVNKKNDLKDPIHEIVERHALPFPHQQTTHTVVPPVLTNETYDRLASVAAMMGDYRSAAEYWGLELKDSDRHLSTITDLTLAYIKLKEYDNAFSTITTYVPKPSDKLVIYATLGDYFVSERQPLDASDAYRKVIQLVPSVDTTDPIVAEAVHRAQDALKR